MMTSFPFYSNQSDAAGSNIYHTHPKCRIAESIATELRVAGTGDEREECPFCFLLAQFQANRALKGNRGVMRPGNFRPESPRNIPPQHFQQL